MKDSFLLAEGKERVGVIERQMVSTLTSEQADVLWRYLASCADALRERDEPEE
ncbi:hypothetical protein VR010_00160 [Actinomycetaceae bacterium L2_0104]